MAFDIGTSMRATTTPAPRPGLGPRALQGVRLLGMDQAEIAEALTRAADENPFLRVRVPDIGCDIPADGPSLYGVLGRQIRMQLAPGEAQIAWALVARLDDNGYLRATPEALAAELGVTLAQLVPVLERLRGFDPAGIAARDLADCFARQLAAQDALTASVRAFLARLEDYAAGRRAEVARACGVGVSELPALAARLRRLNPYPARHYCYRTAPIRRPDLRVVTSPAGLRVELVAEAWPAVTLNDDYGQGLRGAETWLAAQRDRARALQRNITRRAVTVLRVGQAIADRQGAYLRGEAACVAPLRQIDVARATDLHPATVCRAVRGRTMDCARGLVPLADLFAVAAPGDGAQSSDRFKMALRDLMDAETAGSVRSDMALARALAPAFGVIARRTVAKYRAALGAPGAAQRRANQRLKFSDKLN
ncbi:MAG: hypothetical protein AAFZ99_10215 [Pseudomonadota bacterium]